MGLAMESLFLSISNSQLMGHIAPKPKIVCCPLCGEPLSASTSEESNYCPTCGFDVLLVQGSKEPPIPVTVPAYIPRFTVWLIALQVVLAAIFGGLFLFFASPIYFPFSFVFAIIHLVSIGVLLVLNWALRRGIAASGMKIVLLALGFITLPLGTLSLAAAIAIAPLRRYCCFCGKSLPWSAYIECPHCEASMHSAGRCRQNQFHHIAGLLDYTPSQSEIEQICVHCLKEFGASTSEGNEHE